MRVSKHRFSGSARARAQKRSLMTAVEGRLTFGADGILLWLNLLDFVVGAEELLIVVTV